MTEPVVKTVAAFCKATAEVMAQSLVGNHGQEHLFALKQAVELFEF